MIAMGRPTSSEYRSVENYMDNEKPLVEDEAKSYYCKEDLISLRPGREHAWLDATIETTLRRFNCNFIEVCGSQEQAGYNFFLTDDTSGSSAPRKRSRNRTSPKRSITLVRGLKEQS
jgi:hypothetical protein